MTAMFNAAYVGFDLLDKLDSGFIERIRVTPISRAALALGFVLENALVLLIQSAILIGVSHFFFGLTVSVPGSILLTVLLVLVGIVMSSLSFSLAILIRDGGILANAINFFVLPLFLLSGVMLPISFAPPLIQTISRLNPFSYSVDAARLMLAGQIFNQSVGVAFIIFAILSFAALRWFMHVTRQTVA
jgi:ABC-2 type transport system permease protein